MKERIKQVRNYFGLSQTQFSQKIGKTAGCIAKLESRQSNISKDTLDSLCSTFNVNKEWLLNGTGDMFSKEMSPVDRSSFGLRVKSIRKENNLTQQQFADRIGFHKNQVCYVEGGKSIPSDDFLKKVAIEFNVSLHWLKTGCEDDDSERVDDKLIEWLEEHPEVVRRLRVESGLV